MALGYKQAESDYSYLFTLGVVGLKYRKEAAHTLMEGIKYPIGINYCITEFDFGVPMRRYEFSFGFDRTSAYQLQKEKKMPDLSNSGQMNLLNDLNLLESNPKAFKFYNDNGSLRDAEIRLGKIDHIQEIAKTHLQIVYSFTMNIIALNPLSKHNI